MDTLYKEEILDHYKDPHNFTKLEKFDKSSKQTNPFCGDEVELFVIFNNEIISNISFQGKGCAICIASTSILTDHVKGKSKEELTKMTESDMLELLGIEVSETRKKCALLGFYTLKDCIV